MAYFVKGPGNVNHDGKDYAPGDEITGLDEAQAKALLQADAIQTQPLEDGVAPNLVPSDEEVAQTLAEMESNPDPSPSENLEVK